MKKLKYLLIYFTIVFFVVFPMFKLHSQDVDASYIMGSYIDKISDISVSVDSAGIVIEVDLAGVDTIATYYITYSDLLYSILQNIDDSTFVKWNTLVSAAKDSTQKVMWKKFLSASKDSAQYTPDNTIDSTKIINSSVHQDDLDMASIDEIDSSNVVNYGLSWDDIKRKNLAFGNYWLSNDGGNEGIRFDTDGDVGFCTSTITARLHAVGVDATSSNFGLKVEDVSNKLILHARNDGRVFMQAADSTAPALVINEPDGTVGIELRTGNSGSFSTYIGTQTGENITTGTRNTGIGSRVMQGLSSGSNNTACGTQAISSASLVTGSNNTALGTYALQSLTSGSNNAALGANCLVNLTSGTQNLAMGFGSFYFITTTSFNIGIGRYTGYRSIGTGNTLIGGSAMGRTTGSNEVSDYNTMIGYYAGFEITTGNYNIGIGANTGDNITTGSSNLLIGDRIDAQSATGSNQLSIGNAIFGTGIDGTGTTVSNGKIGILEPNPAEELHVAGQIMSLVDVQNNTGTLTADSTNVMGALITNSGDADGSIINLPAAVVGYKFTSVLSVAQDVDINPDNSDRIMVLTDALGDAISSDATIGSYITLIAITDSTWMPLESNGTWSDVD